MSRPVISESVGVLFAEGFKMITWRAVHLPWGGLPRKVVLLLTRAGMDVSVSSFYISETEVTQNLWQAVMGGSQSRHRCQPSKNND